MKYIPLNKLYRKNSTHLYQQAISLRKSNSDCTYCLPVKISGNDAFVLITQEVVSLIASIYIKNNKLTRLYERIPAVATTQHIANNMIEEILSTNEIEAVRSTRGDIELAMKPAPGPRRPRFLSIVKQYNKILNYDEPIWLHAAADLRALYDATLSEDIPPKDRPDGVFFRKGPVTIENPVTQKAQHTGIMPEGQLISFVDASLAWANTADIPDLVRIATLHYLLGYAHPFYDGNGRLARYISSQQMKESLNILLALRLSYGISAARAQYYKAFDLCNDPRSAGDITPFVITFLEILFNTLTPLVDDLSEREQSLKHYKALLNRYYDGNKRQNDLYQIHKLLVENALFAPEGLPIADLQNQSDKTGALSAYQIRERLATLESRHFITVTRPGRHKIYSADLTALDKLDTPQ